MNFSNSFINEQQVCSIIKKKIVNNIFFSKSFVRNNLAKTPDAHIVDNYTSFSLVSEKSLGKLLPKKNLSTFNGYTVNTKEILYTHTLNSFLKFKLNSCFSNQKTLTIISSFEKALSGLIDTDNKFKNIIILKPIKGGFSSYSFGFVGFLPTSQWRIIKNFLFKSLFTYYTKFRRINKKWDSLFYNSLRNSVILEKKQIFRVPFFVGTVAIFPSYKSRVFSANKKKNKIFLNNFNIVFLAEKKKKYYEKFYFKKKNK